MVRVRQTEERDYEWEGSSPVFVVIFYEGSAATSWSHESWELSGCGVLDAVRWAQENVPPRGAWALGLVDLQPDHDGGHLERGFTYLEGFDLNTGAAGLSDWEGRQVDEMVARIGRAVVGPATSTTVFPNGSAATPYSPGGENWFARGD